jgi:DNA-binding NtrC family response regulator
MGFALAEGRLDALRSMVLLVLREIDALKKMLSPEFPRQKLAAGFDLAKELSEIEKAMINTALLKTRGNQVAAAKLLSIKTTTLHEKIKRYRIHKPIGR